MAQLSDNEIFRIAQESFNKGEPIDIDVLFTALSMGSSATDALETALICGITDDVDMICGFLLSPIKNFMMRGYLHALSSFVEQEEKETSAPQKQAPQPRARNNELDKRHTSNVVQRSTESKLILNDNEFKDKSVYFYLDRCQIVDAYIDDIIHNEMPSFCTSAADDVLFEDLARFLRTLPPKSRQIIWKHAVKIKTGDGKKMCPLTKDKEQIIRLFCDCVIVYIKYVHRNIAPLCSDIWIAIQPQVENVAVFIHNKYHSLLGDKFANDKNYFADIIDDYKQQQQRRQAPHQQHDHKRLEFVVKIWKYLTERNSTLTSIRANQFGEDESFSISFDEEALETCAPQTPHMSPVAPPNYERKLNLKRIELNWNNLACLLPMIPSKPRQLIWEHAVGIKTPDGKEILCPQTKDKEQIIRLLSKCVKVFVKIVNYELDRAKGEMWEHLNLKEVKKHLNVEDVAAFILSTYHQLDRAEFVNDDTYFADMLEHYEKVKIYMETHSISNKQKLSG